MKRTQLNTISGSGPGTPEVDRILALKSSLESDASFPSIQASARMRILADSMFTPVVSLFTEDIRTLSRSTREFLKRGAKFFDVNIKDLVGAVSEKFSTYNGDQDSVFRNVANSIKIDIFSKPSLGKDGAVSYIVNSGDDVLPEHEDTNMLNLTESLKNSFNAMSVAGNALSEAVRVSDLQGQIDLLMEKYLKAGYDVPQHPDDQKLYESLVLSQRKSANGFLSAVKGTKIESDLRLAGENEEGVVKRFTSGQDSGKSHRDYLAKVHGNAYSSFFKGAEAYLQDRTRLALLGYNVREFDTALNSEIVGFAKVNSAVISSRYIAVPGDLDRKLNIGLGASKSRDMGL